MYILNIKYIELIFETTNLWQLSSIRGAIPYRSSYYLLIVFSPFQQLGNLLECMGSIDISSL